MTVDEKIRELLSDDIEEAQLPPDRLRAIEERMIREFELPDFQPKRPIPVSPDVSPKKPQGT